jgi:hypothetical protein
MAVSMAKSSSKRLGAVREETFTPFLMLLLLPRLLFAVGPLDENCRYLLVAFPPGGG